LPLSIQNKAKILMILSAASFSIMAAIVKATEHSVTIKSFSRQFITALIAIIIILSNNIRFIPKRKNLNKLFLRCIFGSLGVFLYFYSIDHLYLANVSILTRLSPFFVTIFAFLFLKEKISLINWLIFIPMIIGCILIIQPNSKLFNPISIYAILSAISGAFAYTMIKAIGKEESAYTIVFWFSLSSSIIYFLIGHNEFKIIENINYINLFLIGLFGILGQLGLTKSYQLANASLVAPFSYSYVLFSIIFGIIFWNEIPDTLSILGFFLIIISYFILINNQSYSKS
tara:strand:- start:33 stop:890 length:858 start_codon:yes stop_codon:yes gene_type:complete